MPFRKKSEDPWDYEPERRDPVRREEEPPVSPDGETQDRSACRIPFQSRDAGSQSPPPMACPWCGREMEMGYLSGSRGVFWIRGVPTARKFWLGAGRGNIIRVDTEGGLMTPHRTAWLCRACRRMVMEIPEEEIPKPLTPEEAAEQAEEQRQQEAQRKIDRGLQG